MKIIRCDRCNRRCRNMQGWNATTKSGAIVGCLCPGCQTPEENAEAEIKQATLDYCRDAQGRVWAKPKGTIPELTNAEMRALAASPEGLEFRAAVRHGEMIPALIVAIGTDGPLGYALLGEPWLDPMDVAALVEHVVHNTPNRSRH